ncbi:hypothetical protein JG687_00000711 [Phytophthora cactorum]|uniref:D-isomer specific 2-hydroxyacid dehydrogenase NAD-binding domain-containing protein n=1 Tax=Phytophthora cactorum TaxID=29920 RepID=A0A8T1V1Y7_9STRA|nr:hypothetical protein JG687_00000711 [Phytophthora cactorum]
MPAASKLRVPVVSFLDGMGSAMRKQFAASTTAAGDLFRSGKLEIVDVPVPTLVGNAQNPLNGHKMGDVDAPTWDLTTDHQRVVEQAKIVVMDQHSGGPLFLAPHENLPKDKHHLLRNIEWVQGTYAGVEQYLNRLPHGFLPRIMAQYVFGYVTMLERMLLEARDFQSNRDYAREQLIQFRPAQAVTIGILGLGDIGQGVGKMLRAAGYKVLGFRRRVGPEMDLVLSDCADRITPDLDEVLSTSDYLVNVLPSTSSTRYLLNENNLELCRERKPVFINIGRGDVISEKTIIDALDSGVWSRAVLDVFEQEPLPRESALWAHPSVLLTPHISGYVFVEDVASLFVDNFNRYLRGEPVLYKVDWTAGY